MIEEAEGLGFKIPIVQRVAKTEVRTKKYIVYFVYLLERIANFNTK